MQSTVACTRMADEADKRDGEGVDENAGTRSSR